MMSDTSFFAIINFPNFIGRVIFIVSSKYMCCYNTKHVIHFIKKSPISDTLKFDKNLNIIKKIK